jgi:alkanesulfonate monooxygenase SsuD/methylene tetrahydromethanopterin reductase-like flavin-dependent oxidoreductase (luciferase family)
MNERQWEAMDLIVKAWTHHDGPFSHEGRFFHHRNINIWPRCYQQPHPPVWVSTTTPSGAKRVGAHGYVQATFLTGYKDTQAIYDNYRAGWREAGRGHDVPVNRLAYACLLYVGDTEAEARSGAEKLMWYMTANKVPPHLQYPPGYMPVSANVRIMRGTALDQHAANKANATVDRAIEAGIMFAGTPDQVYQQIKKFYHHVGGFGHLLIMGQAGFLEHEETVAGIRCFARNVYPRLKDEFSDLAVSGVPAERVVA